MFGTISGLGLWANFMLKSTFALIGFKAYLWVIEEIVGIKINIEIAISSTCNNCGNQHPWCQANQKGTDANRIDFSKLPVSIVRLCLGNCRYKLG